jgi:hypothetical protein
VSFVQKSCLTLELFVEDHLESGVTFEEFPHDSGE